jgi:hypothetical protein
MKFNFRSYWWVAFLALNFVSSKAVASTSEEKARAAEIVRKTLPITGVPTASEPAASSIVPSAPPSALTPSTALPGSLVSPAPAAPATSLAEALASAPTVPGAPIPKARLQALIPDLDLEEELDANNNLILKGTVPACAKGSLLIKHRPLFRANVLMLSFIDKDGKFQECVDRCERGEGRGRECDKIEINSLATIPGQSKDPLDIVIANSDGTYDPDPIGRLLSSEDAELEVLAWQAENCRGQKDGLTAAKKWRSSCLPPRRWRSSTRRATSKAPRNFATSSSRKSKAC